MRTNSIINEIGKKAKSNQKFVRGLLISFLLLIVGLPIFLFSLLSFIISKGAISLVLLISSIFISICGGFLAKKYNLKKVPLNYKDKITFNLLKLSDKIEKYVSNSALNFDSFDSTSNKEFRNLKLIIKESVDHYKGMTSISDKNLEFLLNLDSYLKSNLEKIKEGKLDSNELIGLKEKLKFLAISIYDEKFDEALEILGKNPKMSSENKILSFLLSGSFLSHFITFFTLIIVVIFMFSKFPLVDLKDFSSYIGIFLSMVSFSLYNRIQSYVYNLFEFLSSISGTQEIIWDAQNSKH